MAISVFHVIQTCRHKHVEKYKHHTHPPTPPTLTTGFSKCQVLGNGRIKKHVFEVSLHNLQRSHSHQNNRKEEQGEQQKTLRKPQREKSMKMNE